MKIFGDSSENQNHAQNYWIDADLFANSADGYKSIYSGDSRYKIL